MDRRDLKQHIDSYKSVSNIILNDEYLRNIKEFINKIPKDLVLPRPMINSDNAVGLYWNFNDTYIDIIFEKNNVSVFTKTKGGLEKYKENLNIEAVSNDFFENIKKVLNGEEVVII